MADTWRNPGLGGKVGNQTTVKVPAVNKKPRPIRPTAPRGMAGVAEREDPHHAYPAQKSMSATAFMKTGKRK